MTGRDHDLKCRVGWDLIAISLLRSVIAAEAPNKLLHARDRSQRAAEFGVSQMTPPSWQTRLCRRR
jgi:hypothetical protein